MSDLTNDDLIKVSAIREEALKAAVALGDFIEKCTLIAPEAKDDWMEYWNGMALESRRTLVECGGWNVPNLMLYTALVRQFLMELVIMKGDPDTTAVVN